MADSSVAGLRAAIKALKEVVAPAVDPGNPLAVEQLRMVSGYLSLLVERLPHRMQRIAFELQQATLLGEAIGRHATNMASDATRALEAALVAARQVAGRSDVAEAEVEAVTAALSAATSALVRSAAAADPDTRKRIERTVVAHSKVWLDVHRAWFQPLGFDAEAAQLQSLDAMFRAMPPI